MKGKEHQINITFAIMRIISLSGIGLMGFRKQAIQLASENMSHPTPLIHFPAEMFLGIVSITRGIVDSARVFLSFSPESAVTTTHSPEGAVMMIGAGLILLSTLPYLVSTQAPREW